MVLSCMYLKSYLFLRATDFLRSWGKIIVCKFENVAPSKTLKVFCFACIVKWFSSFYFLFQPVFTQSIHNILILKLKTKWHKDFNLLYII